MARAPLALLCTVLITAAGSAAPIGDDFAVGLWHRPITDAEARASLWQDCERSGVTDLFVQTFYHGFTIYPSNAERTFEQRPELEGSDLLGEYIEEAHERGIRVHAWLDTMLWAPDPVRQPEIPLNQYVESRPDWRMVDAEGRTTRQQFVSPGNTEVTNLVTLLALEIGHQHPEIDGIHLDRMRFPGGGDFVFDTGTVGSFIAQGGADPREDDSDENLAAFRRHCAGRLTGLVDQIGLVIDGIHGDGLTLSAAALADARPDDADDMRYQDWEAWLDTGRLDMVVPKCFAGDLDSITAEAASAAANAALRGVPCWIGLAWRDGEERPGVADQLRAVEDLPIQGVVWMSHRWMASDPEQLDALGSWSRAGRASN